MTTPPTDIAGRIGLPERATLLWVRGHLWDHLGLLIVALWAFVCWKFEAPVLLTEVAPEARRAIFQTTATVAGTMAGLTFTSISIMINLVKTPMSTLDRIIDPAEKKNVGDVFISVLPKLLLTLGLALATIAIEPNRGEGVWWIEGLTIWFALAAVSGMARVVWVLKRLLKLS